MKLNIDIVVNIVLHHSAFGIWYEQCRFYYAVCSAFSVCFKCWESKRRPKYHIIKQTVCHHVSTHMCICKWSRSCCQMLKQMKRKKKPNELWMLKRWNKYKTCVHKLSANVYLDCRFFVFSLSSSTIAMCLAYRCVNMLNNSTGWRWTTKMHDMWIDDEAVTLIGFFFYTIARKSDFFQFFL